MPSKTQPPSESTSRQRRISLRDCILVICWLLLPVLILPSFYLYGSSPGFNSLFNDLKSSVSQGGLGQTANALGIALKQVLSEVRIHVSDIAYYQPHYAESKRSKRQLTGGLPGLTGAGSNAGGTSTSAGSAGGSGGLGGLLSGASGDNPLSQLVTGLKNDLGGAANALGAGLSDGAIKGLNLNEMMSMGPVTEPAHENDVEKVAWNLGEGASEALTSKIDITSVAPLDQIGPGALAFGSGLGDGIVNGLHLADVSAPNSSDATMVVELTGNLGYGLTNAIFGHIDLMSMAGGPMGQMMMIEMSKIPGPAGKGLGEGTVEGLKLPSIGMPKVDAGDSGTLDPATMSEGFTRAFASSLLGHIDFAALSKTPQSQQMMQKVMKQLATIPGPAGKGLGEGAAEGLHLGGAAPKNEIGSGDFNAAVASEDFTRSLASSFLGSINVQSLTSSPQSIELMKQLVKIPGPAGKGLGQGAAIGLKLAPAVPETSDNGTFDAGSASEDFTRNLASSFLGSANISMQANQQQMLTMAAQVAPSVAKGLGKGAAQGLEEAQTGKPPASRLKRQAAVPAEVADALPSIAGDFSENLAESFVGNLDLKAMAGPEQQQQLFAALGQAAPYAGAGLGEGAAEGLGFAQPPSEVTGLVKRQQQPVPANISSIAKDFTRALSYSFLSTANASALLSGGAAGPQEKAMIGPAVLGLGEGFGHGAATALHLQEDPPPTVNASDMESITRGFSYSFVTSFLDDETLINLGKMVADQPPIPMVPAMQGLGKGFGHGAAAGLGLQPDMPPPASATDIPSILQGFSDSLTTSFLANDSIKKMQEMALSQMPVKPVLAAEGLGRGFGGGAASLFGVTDPGPDSNANDIPSILQGLSQSMTTSFLNPEVVDKLQTIMSQMMPTNLNISRIAEGLAVGLVDGGSEVIFDQTGLGNGSLIGDSSNTFNDSVQGAATGFGRGLGFEGAKVLFMALGNDDVAQNVSGLVDGASSDAAASTPTTSPSKRDVVPAMRIVRRSPPANTTDAMMSGLMQNLNMTSVNGLMQKAVDALGCTGTGGMIQVALGLADDMKGKKMPKLPAMPAINATFNITQNGNRVQVDLATNAITINGLSVKKLAGLMIAHLLFAMSLYFALPTAMLLEAARDLTVLAGRPDRLAFAPKLALPLQASLPVMAVIACGLGAGLSGTKPRANGGHTAHQVLGWFALVATLAAFALHLLWTRNPVHRGVRIARSVASKLLLLLLGVEVLLGFKDVSDMTFCATQAVPFPLAFAGGAFMAAVVWVAVGALLARWLVERWIERRSGSASGGSGGVGGETLRGSGDEGVGVDAAGETEIVPSKEESGRGMVSEDSVRRPQPPFPSQLPPMPPKYESGGWIKRKAAPPLRSRFSED